MKQVLIRNGRVVVEDMPAPAIRRGAVLVRTTCSLISTGTELAAVAQSVAPDGPAQWRRRAAKAGEVARMALDRGVGDTVVALRARLQGTARPTGYSLAGTVTEVGPGVADLAPGERVACAGAGVALHAETVAVPRNLVVPVPEGLDDEAAAFVAIGAIALQAVRSADARIGEHACVVGLGLVGQLVVELLHASGCRVLGSDVDEARVERARAAGLEIGVVAGRDDLESAVRSWTDARGADVVLLTASTESSEPARQALRVLRRRGRVIVVGAVGLDLDRTTLYEKDAELRVACSYGPGRYDPDYEERGHDYPYDYVRWTENRNMAEFLRLARAGRVFPARLIDARHPIESAPVAYEALASDAPHPLAVLLQYPTRERPEAAVARRIEVAPRRRARDTLGVALVGPGAFARATHLPNLAAIASRARLRAIVGRTAESAREAARRSAADYATTDLDEVLRDPEIDVVLICTRHDQHAELGTRALLAGKALFLEKPAALDDSGLDALEAAVAASGQPFTLGFNRRFAPLVLELARQIGERRGPLLLQYRVNAGPLPAEHWLHGAGGGGRLVGEACHMIDLSTHLLGTPPDRHSLDLLPPGGRRGRALGDDFALTCRHDDGSLSSLVYTSIGDASTGKERIEAHWDGRSAVIDDFRSGSEAQDKGHLELLRRFLAHVRGEQPAPIPHAEIFSTSRFVLALDREARGSMLPDLP